ncbi:MAG: PAS domain S-box protein [Candidatus Hydrogenedentales bacterium]|jgi:PAS domain S-box-containing protein
MKITSFPAMLLVGAILCTGAHNAAAWVRFRERKVHLAFAIACVFVAFYTAAAAGLYSAATPLDGQFWQRLQITSTVFAAIAFVWFIWLYTGQLSVYVRNTFSIYYAISGLVLWFDRSGFSWPTDRPAIKQVDLPLGLQVVYQEMAPGPLVEITSAIGMVFLVYILYACLRFYRTSDKAKARVLLWALTLFVVGVINDMSVTVGTYKFIYIMEYCYFGMVLLADHALTRDLMEAVFRQEDSRDGEGRYARLFQHTDHVYFELNPEGRIQDVSPAVLRVMTLPPAEVIGKNVEEFCVSSEQREALCQRIRETGRVADFDVRLRLGRGREGDFAVSAALVGDAGGLPGSVVGTLRDVTKRKEKEQQFTRAADLYKRMRTLAKALDDAESFSAGLTEALQAALEVTDSQAGAIYVLEKGRLSLRARQNFPLAAATALETLPDQSDEFWSALPPNRSRTLGSLPWDSPAPPELREYQRALLTPCVGRNQVVGYLVLAVPNGTESRGAAAAENVVASEIGMFIARSRFVESVQRAREEFQRAQEFAHVGNWEFDVTDKKLRGSRETGRIFGFPEHLKEVTLDQFFEALHPVDRERVATAIGRFVRGEADTYDVEYQITRQRDGETRVVHSLAQAVEDEAGPVTKVRGTVQDITERKELQQQLLLAQRMESVGLLAGGIAHDFNNFLSVILSYSDMAAENLEPSEPKYAMIHEIASAAERARHLTHQLLAFSRRQVMEMRVIDLNAVLRDMAPMLGRLIGEGIELRLELDEQVRPIEADIAQIQQIMMNLAVNGRDAMPQGGVLAIATRVVDVEDHEERHPPTRPAPGAYSVIMVSDNGCGMTPEVLEHVFDPFFTTKAVGKGTGLGLATVYGIAKQHGGYIWADSIPGKGTRFRLYLPAIDKQPEGRLRPKPLAGSARGHETILVVEDEEMVRNLTCNVLRKYGYTVLTAQDGEDALRVAESSGNAIDLLLTDVVMPRMGGLELYEQLAPRVPRMKVLFMSGYANELVSDCVALGPDTVLLQKPFTVQSLTEQVRSMLDG